MTIKIAILAGGLATRLSPLSDGIPKSLVTISGKPFIGWQLSLLAKSGIRNVILCLGHKSELIQNYVGDGNRFGIQVEYSIENVPLGTGGALINCLDKLGGEFGVLYGDSYVQIDFKHIISEFSSIAEKSMITVYENEDKFDQSNVELLSNGLIRYSKTSKTSRMKFVDSGFLLFKEKAFEDWPKSNFLDLSQVLENLSNENEVRGHEIQNRFYEVGSFTGITDFENFIERNQIEFLQ